MPDSDELRLHVPGDHAKAINVIDSLLRGAAGRPAAEPRFAALVAWATNRVRLTPMAEAQLVLYAGNARQDPAAAGAAAQSAAAAGKTCLFFDAGDTWEPFPLDEGVLYRTSLDRRLRRPGERAMPAMVRDLREEAAEAGDDDEALLGPAPHAARPRVGFCGYVGTPGHRLACLAMLRLQKWRGLRTRARTLDALRRQSASGGGFDTDFVTRAAFGQAVPEGEAARLMRREFLQNLLENPYTLCLRGKGNFSFRLYEVLGVGRVPLFVDTHCVLPFEDELDWPALMPMADAGNLAAAGETFTKFHQQFDAETFAAHQRRLHETWRDWLSPVGFVRQLLRLHGS